MYLHRQELQHPATPEQPDAVYARKLQEVLGGQYGEITIAMQYSFQAWNAGFVTASGNLLADFHANANAEMHGRLAAARLFHQTDDTGVRDLLAFLIARDTMHQNQWIAAARELEEDGLEEMPVPSNFPQSKEHHDVAYDYVNFSDGERAAEGSWASGPSPDGKGEFGYREAPGPGEGAPMPAPTRPDPRLYGTTDVPNVVEKVKGSVKDKFHKE